MRSRRPATGAGFPPVPLYLRILVGAAAGVAAGMALGAGASPLGDAGLLVIRVLKTLATPLIVLAVLDAFLSTRIAARQGGTLVILSVVNAAVAVVIGLGVAHLIRGGEAWQGRIDEIRGALASVSTIAIPHPVADASLGFMANVARFIPVNIVDPFREGGVIPAILLAIFTGAALRSVLERGDAATVAAVARIGTVIRAGYTVVATMLGWTVQVIPFAVFGVVATVVGATGPGVFSILWAFLATILIGLLLQAAGWYSVLLLVVGRRSPLAFFRGARDAVVTALSCASSLATLPVTLKCLDEKLKVSHASARLAACVGTNLNHDGIILYEAAAAIFMLQAFGMPAGAGVQLTVAFAAVMAGVGIAGVPEAGLITLPLVLGAAGLPEAATATVIPLILPVDWILGRCRAAVNVLSDMTVAVLLDRLAGTAAPRKAGA